METANILQFPKRETGLDPKTVRDTDAVVVAISDSVARLRERTNEETADIEMTLERLTIELAQFQEIRRQIDAEQEKVKQLIGTVGEQTDTKTRKELRGQLRQLNQASTTLQDIIRDTSERWGDTALYLKFGMPIDTDESETA